MNIVITGASRGIGFSIIKHLSKNTNNNIHILTRNIEILSNRIKSDDFLSKANIKVYYLDLISFSDKDLHNITFNIDVLINNSGLLISKSFDKLEDEEWETMFKTNIFGPAKLIKYLLPLMGKNKLPTHIVNIGSMGGFQGSSKFVGLSAYSASKAALANLTECFAEEYKDNNIKSNCLCLGAVNTDMLKEAFPNYIAPISSNEMGKFIADFALNGHKYFNGKILPVSTTTP
jgi:NAD(P)-dependent dehydrogenase (short-subunit alcohol dehydrogenase family)